MAETKPNLVERLSEEVAKNLKLDGLKQISQADLPGSQYSFTGLGEILLHYSCEVVEGDAYAARLVGSDSSKQVKRGTLTDSYFFCIKSAPQSSTHYFLGKRQSIEELSLRHKEDSRSYDRIPIVFLRDDHPWSKGRRGD